MNISLIVENISDNPRLKGEVGLSVMVETDNRCYLIDTGASSLIIDNLINMGFYPDTVPCIIISHNHNDHIGGLESLLERNKTAKVYISKNALGEYVKVKNGSITVLSNNNALTNLSERFEFIEDEKYISDNVVLCHVNNPLPKFQCKDLSLMEISQSKIVHDKFKHEIYVVVIEKKHYNIISPCSHNGILNVIADAKRRFPNYKLSSYVGGLHMQESCGTKMYCTQKEISDIADSLNETDINALYTFHCTGEKAYSILKKSCSFPVFYLHTGMEIQI